MTKPVLKVKGVAKKQPSNPRLLATAPKQTTLSSEQLGHLEMCCQVPKWPDEWFEVQNKKCSNPHSAVFKNYHKVVNEEECHKVHAV